MRKKVTRVLFFSLLILISGCNEDIPGLSPSGLNSTFSLPPDTAFKAYIEHYRTVIENSRIDLNTPDRDKIIDANLPFELVPDKENPRKGILLVHGLFDSPYHMKTLGKYFQEKGFLVRSILLPGHGTIPGDQLEMDLNDWQKATAYGVNSLRNEVDTLYIAGYSTGAALAVLYAIENEGAVDALFLFSPCLKVNSGLDWLAGPFSTIKKWLITRKNFDFARYESFATNSGAQIFQLTRKINNLISETDLKIPVFAVLSRNDRTVNSPHTVAFFQKKITDPTSRLIIYTDGSTPRSYPDERISVVDVSDTSANILSSAHTAIIIPPENDHYGQQGDYRNCLHYFYSSEDSVECRSGADISFGEITTENLAKGTMRRLTWNPKYHAMLENIDAFLEKLPAN